MCKKYLLLILAIIVFLSCSVSKKLEEYKGINEISMLVGTYTAGNSEGIYVYRFDTITGDARLMSSVKQANPSYLAISENGKLVYAVTESNDEHDAVYAYEFNEEEAKLNLLNSQLTKGAAPCFVAIHPLDGSVVTANYSGGSITVFDVNENGSLLESKELLQFEGKGLCPERQVSTHMHTVVYSPDSKYLFATDLGTDKLYKLEVLKGETKLSDPMFIDLAAGSGPRHLVFHPQGTFIYVITEISGDVVAYNYKDDVIDEFQVIKADSLNAQGSGDIQISKDGKFLYASNRLKADGLAIFSINNENGMLTKVGYQDTGIHPRNFAITENDKFVLVACKDSRKIQVFERDKATGLLTDTKKDIEIDMPVCIKFASAD